MELGICYKASEILLTVNRICHNGTEFYKVVLKEKDACKLILLNVKEDISGKGVSGGIRTPGVNHT